MLSLVKEKNVVPIYSLMDKDNLLKDKVVLITGGSGGIGLAIAKKFIESGAKVVITGTNEEKLKSIKDRFNTPCLKTMVLDVKNVKDIEFVVNEACLLFEKKCIDVLVNCAGIINKNEFLDISEEEYDRIMSINTKGVFFACQFAVKKMIETNTKGHILNITSSSALRPAWTPYQMSKWAVRGLTIGLADLFSKYGIVINAIGPGQTATEMAGKMEGDTIYNPTNPMKRMVVAEEVANMALILASDMGAMICGDTVYVSGGSGITTLHN